MRECIAFISHVATPPVLRVFERLRRETPVDLDVRFILSSDEMVPDQAPGNRLDQITRADLFNLGYPGKSRAADWEMAGNLDLVFLAFAGRHPEYERIWFIEYDVHWEGRWDVLFERFRSSTADVLATIILRIADAPHKLRALSYPPLILPVEPEWNEAQLLKAFLPICRLSRAALDALHKIYQAGFGGHYEVMVPSAAAIAGLGIEDIGGNGPFVRPENRNRFYFAQPATSSHSPGSFVFRPAPKVLRRPNTLWHPVKPQNVPLWHPLRITGSPLKSLLEWVKPFLWQAVTCLWFSTRWRPLDAKASR